ncbi:hypothetical protein [Paenibacillus periandrae]|uniref:hypothetical protein n=1 Tax=Paenibacillus periandrae TaxID=1761741 RepID=UPI001F08BE3C|nr:hypothetical protein [Paenibacillus periandrae]
MKIFNKFFGLSRHHEKRLLKEASHCWNYNPQWHVDCAGIEFYTEDGLHLVARKGNVILRKQPIFFEINKWRPQIYDFFSNVWVLAQDEGVKRLHWFLEPRLMVIEWTNYEDYYDMFHLKASLVDKDYMYYLLLLKDIKQLSLTVIKQRFEELDIKLQHAATQEEVKYIDLEMSALTKVQQEKLNNYREANSYS